MTDTDRALLEKAAIGDTVACNVRHPYPQTLAFTLETQAAANYANELLSDSRSGWRIVRAAASMAWE